MENHEIFTPEILSPEHVRVLVPHDPELAHYNAAVIRSKKSSDNLWILLREVPLVSVRAGIPDKGNLVLYRSTPEKVERIAKLGLSRVDISHLEDPRGFKSEQSLVNVCGVEYEQVTIGLTAICASDNRPVAATVRGYLMSDDFQIEMESFAVYLEDEGKNVTPISLDQFLFRRNGFSHTLELVENTQDGNGQNMFRVIQTIQFPKRSWCEWGIGTQAQFLEDRILPIHGVNRVSLGTRPDGEEVFEYSYSLGLAQLDVDNQVIKVSDKPLFTRKSFENVLPMEQELDPAKHVVYCCGYSVDDGMVRFVVNIGDLMTVEVTKSMVDLKAMLDLPSVVMPDEARLDESGIK